MDDHEERGHHRHHETRRQAAEWWRQPHKDWRVWVVVALMLLAMAIYVFTMDEAVQPGEPVQPPVPAAP